MAVRWTTVRDMVLAWVITLPAAGGFPAAWPTYLLLTILLIFVSLPDGISPVVRLTTHIHIISMHSCISTVSF